MVIPFAVAPEVLIVTCPGAVAEPASTKVPCTEFCTPWVGVAVHDDAVLLVAFGTVPWDALVAFVPPPLIGMVGRSLVAIVPHAGAALALPVPVWVRKFLVLVVLPASLVPAPLVPP